LMFWLSATSRSMAAFTGALQEARARFQWAGAWHDDRGGRVIVL
jgi:hypothetical protein